MGARPEYTGFDDYARDEFLSHISTFSPVERDIFARLCDAWAPTIPYHQFLASIKDVESAENALGHLMGKLKSARIGLITTAVVNDSRAPSGIVLTAKGSLEFWIHYLEEINATLQAGDFWVFPTTATLAEHGFRPPDYHLTDTDSTQLNEIYQRKDHEPAILQMRLLEGCRVVFTAANTRNFIDQAVAWFRKDLNERGFLAEMARIKDTSLSELQKRLASGEREATLDITRTMLSERTSLAYRRNTDESDQVFQIAFLLLNFVEAQLGAVTERKEQEASLEREIEVIEASVNGADGLFMTQDRFAEIVDAAQGRLGDAGIRFPERLTARLLTPKPRRRLSIILYINGVYIHRDRIREFFDLRHAPLSLKLVDEYIDLMEGFLRGRTTLAGEILGSRDRLEEDIQSRVERHDPLLGEFLAHPQLLAEALVHDARRRNEKARPDEIKAAIGKYIDITESKLQPLSELFGISAVRILDTAFSRVNVFRQLILRFSGRYESIRQTYLRRFPPPAARSRSGEDLARNAAERRRAADRALARDTATPSRGGAAPRRSESTRRAASPPKPRAKSPQELDAAWKEFDKALRSRPRNTGEGEES